MGYEICNLEDDIGRSMLDQQEQHTIWREEEQLCNNMEEIFGGSKSVVISNDEGMTSW